MIETLPLTHLLVLLLVLLCFSAFFSGSETGMMSLNRYKLKHKAKTSNTAKRIDKLLSRPDRLLGVILIGNNFVNISASAIATILGIRLWGDAGVIVATVLLTFVILVFSEITPKTLAALKSDTVAHWSVYPLSFLLFFLYPFVWFVNIISNSLLQLIHVHPQKTKQEALTREELKSVVTDASHYISSHHQQMLSAILDLEKATVNDIMIPKSEIHGIDLDDDLTQIKEQINYTQHSFLIVYQKKVDNVLGIIHTRNLANALTQETFSLDLLNQCLQKPYFVFEGTKLHSQLIQFQKNKRRLGLIVDEYGELLGLVTLSDILEEIVGEFTTDIADTHVDIMPQPDKSFLVDGTLTLREIERELDIQFKAESSTTLSGLITETIETIPKADSCVLIQQYPVEIVQVQNNLVKTAKIFPKLEKS